MTSSGFWWCKSWSTGMAIIAICYTRHLLRFEGIMGHTRPKNKSFEGLSFDTKIKINGK